MNLSFEISNEIFDTVEFPYSLKSGLSFSLKAFALSDIVLKGLLLLA